MRPTREARGPHGAGPWLTAATVSVRFTVTHLSSSRADKILMRNLFLFYHLLLIKKIHSHTRALIILPGTCSSSQCPSTCAGRLARSHTSPSPQQGG